MRIAAGSVISWRLWSVVLALSQIVQATPQHAVYQNTTIQPLPATTRNISVVGDSVLSASERNRRLIPYMAFYLPPTEYPVNQQYATQRGKLPPSAIESAGPLPPPGHIPIPTAYVRMKLPAAADEAELPYQSALYQSGPGDIYHTIAYGGQHPVPATFKELGKPPLLHLLPPGQSRPLSSGLASSPIKQKTVQHFPPLPVQTQTQPQPPLTLPHQQQQQQQQVPVYNQRPKQSKINLTPFTPSNSLPGHFVPIIYTPVHSGSTGISNGINNKNNNIIANDHDDVYDDNNNPNDSYEEQPATGAQLEHQQKQQQPQPQPQAIQQFKSSHKLLQLEQQQNEADYVQEQQLKQQQQQQPPMSPHEIQFIAVTGSPTSNDGASSPIYHVINEAGAPAAAQQQSQQSPPPQMPQARPPPQHQPKLINFKHHQHQQQQLLLQQQPQQYQRKHPHFHPPKPENFFNDESPQYEQQSLRPSQYKQHGQQQQPYLNLDNMTPQEKYVLYLQQRIRYDKQQQHKQRERIKEHEQYLKHQQFQQHQQLQQHQSQTPSHIFLIDSTLSPVATVRPIDLPPRYYQPQQQQQQPKLVHQQQQQQHQLNTLQEQAPPPPPPPPQYNYPQHNPVGHDVYARPELELPVNHQPSLTASKPAQQVLRIPLRTIVSELDALQQQQQQQQSYKQISNGQQQLFKSHYPKSGGVSTPHYVDYIIDEPKQTLDEDQHHNLQRPQTLAKTTLSPTAPQAAYIVITASPQPPLDPGVKQQPSPQQQFVSTVRPVYKSQPTLRLRPVTPPVHTVFAPTRRPPPTTPQDYIYVSSKPTYGQVLTPTQSPKAKLQPAYKYAARVKPTLAPSVSTPPAETPSHAQVPATQDSEQLPDIRTSSLAEILHKLQASNHLPQTLTPDNIDNSIKTLITILNNLKQTQTVVPNPPQHHEAPPPSSASTDYDYSNGSEEQHQDLNLLAKPKPNKHPGPSTGRPGIDYPNYADIPRTSFDCGQQRYKGFFGDPETNCQVWHYCDLNGGKASFLCPNGTIFSQIALTCDWWFNVKCATTPQLYVLNERLYKYILPFNPKFPEDYSGPLVDKYLAMKFQEMEDKMKQEKEKVAAQSVATATAAVETAATETVETEPDNSQTRVEETTTPTPEPPKQHTSVNSQVSEQSSERNLLIDDEVEDIAQRGTYDSYAGGGDTTTAAAVATTREAELPLSLKPIVVSSTVGPDYDAADESNDKSEVNDDKSVSEQSYAPQQATKESTKISVEKVEVIEIKSDGTTGHLTPTMYFTNNDVKKK